MLWRYFNMHSVRRAYRFLTEGIWDIELSSLPTIPRWGVNTVRVIHLVYNGFRENECPLHASALTYSSLMAIVPTLAIALSVLRGLGAGEWAEQRIIAAIINMPDQFQHFVTNILSYVRNTNFATLGGIGLALLLWIVVQVIGQVEMSFNRVWGVQNQRPLLRKFTDYMGVIMVVPVLMIAATTLNTTLNSPAIANLLKTHVGLIHTWYVHLMQFTPLAAIWLAFTFLYKFMPNTRVNIGPALFSGIIGGSLWIGWQKIYIATQMGVSKYNAIYAAFASVPIFLFWLYVSWQIVLLGAEVGFALQNYATYKMEQRAHDASLQARVMLALSIMSHAAQAMLVKVPCFEVPAYARRHRVPVRLINEVVEVLCRAGMLGEIAGDNRCYVLLRTPDAIRVKEIISIITQAGASPQSLGLDHLNPAIRHVMGKMDAGMAEALKDFNIPDLLQLHARLSDSRESLNQ